MKRCESLVTTRILSALNQAETSGFLKSVTEHPQKQFTLEVYVTTVNIKLNVHSGVSTMSVTESGVDLRSGIAESSAKD